MLRITTTILPLLTKPTNFLKCATYLQSNNLIRFYSKDTEMNAWMQTLDEAQQKRIRFIQNELTLRRLEDKSVPTLDKVTRDDYERMLDLSPNQRRKYYGYLFKTEHADNSDIIKREIRRRVTEEKKELWKKSADDISTEEKHIDYGLGKNALMPKIYKRTTNKWQNTRALWRHIYGEPKIIYDCGYSGDMNFRENFEAAKQLTLCFSLNRAHRSPFVMHYCGMHSRSMLWKNLQKNIPTITQRPLPIKIHEEDICDLFPNEKLVLLTPDSPNILQEYNPEDYYVVSGIVDRGDKVPYTFAKAKKFNLRTARLPLEQYRRCRQNKVLTLDQVLRIMLEVKHSGDWNKAFRYVAARKFY